MVFVYPIGVPLASFVVLFLHRHRINPKVEDRDDESLPGEDLVRSSYSTSARQTVLAIQQRSGDPKLVWFGFLFDEYEPRCWWFAVAELMNRLYLTGIISFFGSHGDVVTTTQVALGLLGAMVYYVVLSA